MQYKSKIFSFYDEQYFATIHIFHFMEEKLVTRYINKHFPEVEYKREAGNAGMCLTFFQQDGYEEYAIDFMTCLKSNDPRSQDLIAHEADHIAWEILSSRGIKVDFDNQEAHAYMLGFLVSKINSGLMKKR